MGIFERYKKVVKNMDFPFEDEPNTASFVCVHILDDNEPILYVSHDSDDGMWQFLCGKSHETNEARIVSLYSVFMKDKTVGELTNMPCGYYAERNTVKDKWVITRHKVSEDDNIDWNTQYKFVESINIKDYKSLHFDECKYIWKNLVPSQGQANYLQGELLRQAEKLRNEAMDNGNRNWDENYVWFCDFLKDTLIKSEIFEEEKNKKIEQIIDYIKDNGNYAKKYSDGEIADEDCDIFHLAYTGEDLYDYLEDAIAEFYLRNKELIEYQKKEFIYR